MVRIHTNNNYIFLLLAGITMYQESCLCITVVRNRILLKTCSVLQVLLLVLTHWNWKLELIRR